MAPIWVSGGVHCRVLLQVFEVQDERPNDLAKRDAHIARADGHAAGRRFEDACYELERASALDPSLKPRLEAMRSRADVENLRVWAERHLASGKKNEAIDCYERLLRRDPADAAARARLVELDSSKEDRASR